MRHWNRREEAHFRRALRQHLRAGPPADRRTFRRATRADCHRPWKRAFTLGWTGFLFFGGIPLGIVSYLLPLTKNPSFFAAWPYALLLWAWWTATLCRNHLYQGPDLIACRLLPLGMAEFLRGQLRSFWVSAAWMVVMWTMLALSLRIMTAGLLSAMWWGSGDLLALMVSVLLMLKFAGRSPPFVVTIGLAAAWGLRMYGESLGLFLAHPLDLLATATPPGWMRMAQSRAEAGDVVLAVAWGLLTLPAAWLGWHFLRETSQVLVNFFDFAEWENGEDEPDLSARDAVPMDSPPRQGLDAWALRGIQPGQQDWVDFFAGEKFQTARNWRQCFALSVAGMGVSVIPSEYAVGLSFLLLLMGLMLSTPWLGGGWRTVVPQAGMPALDSVFAVYPLDVRMLLRDLRRINRRRLLAALPLWLLLPLAVARLSPDVGWTAFTMTLLGWLTVWGWQDLALWFRLFSYSPVCHRGKWWRGLLPGIAIILWGISLLGTLVACVMVPMGEMAPTWWLGGWGLVWGGGWTLVRGVLRAGQGSAYDWIVKPQRASAG